MKSKLGKAAVFIKYFSENKEFLLNIQNEVYHKMVEYVEKVIPQSEISSTDADILVGYSVFYDSLISSKFEYSAERAKNVMDLIYLISKINEQKYKEYLWSVATFSVYSPVSKKKFKKFLEFDNLNKYTCNSVKRTFETYRKKLDKNVTYFINKKNDQEIEKQKVAKYILDSAIEKSKDPEISTLIRQENIVIGMIHKWMMHLKNDFEYCLKLSNYMSRLLITVDTISRPKVLEILSLVLEYRINLNPFEEKLEPIQTNDMSMKWKINFIVKCYLPEPPRAFFDYQNEGLIFELENSVTYDEISPFEKLDDDIKNADKLYALLTNEEEHNFGKLMEKIIEDLGTKEDKRILKDTSGQDYQSISNDLFYAYNESLVEGDFVAIHRIKRPFRTMYHIFKFYGPAFFRDYILPELKPILDFDFEDVDYAHLCKIIAFDVLSAFVRTAKYYYNKYTDLYLECMTIMHELYDEGASNEFKKLYRQSIRQCFKNRDPLRIDQSLLQLINQLPSTSIKITQKNIELIASYGIAFNWKSLPYLQKCVEKYIE